MRAKMISDNSKKKKCRNRPKDKMMIEMISEEFE